MNRVATIILYLMFSIHAPAYAEAKEGINDPYTIVKQATSRTFLRMKTERDKINSNPELIEEIVEQELLPYVDYKFAALKILGKYFRQYNRAEIEKYVEVFKCYSVSVFSDALKYYDDQTVEFEPPQDVSDKKYAVIRIRINNADKPVKLSFLARKDNKTKEWRVYDIIAEGVSMVSSLQSQFAYVLRTEGLAAVMESMKTKGN